MNQPTIHQANPTGRPALSGIPNLNPTVPPERRRISKKSIADDIRAGFPDASVMERHGLTRSQLNVVLRTLEHDGLLDTIYTCPSCGLRASEPIVECPRCGIVIAKLASMGAKRASIWELLYGCMEKAWDAIDCGGYRLIMVIKGKWKSRLG